MLKKHAHVIKEASRKHTHRHELVLCPDCTGEGIRLYTDEFPNLTSWRDTCDTCNGTGRLMMDVDTNYFVIKD